jgi:hypothetical protein
MMACKMKKKVSNLAREQLVLKVGLAPSLAHEIRFSFFLICGVSSNCFVLNKLANK